jgi:hypothetical protein
MPHASGVEPAAPCSHCGAAAAPSACSGCKSAFYCAAACQKAHWRVHKAPCRAIAAAWHSRDQCSYGAWAARLCALLAVRPMFSTVAFHLDHCVFRDPDAPGALPSPLRGFSSMASPCLSPSLAQEVLLLAAEARAAILTAPSAAARRSLEANAFTLTLLAASPDVAWGGAPTGSLPEAWPTAGLVHKAMAAAGRFLRAPTGNASAGVSPSGGNAEAQFLIGLDYFMGAAPGCPDGRRLWIPALYWILMSCRGGHAPAMAWLQHEGIF